MLSKKIKYMLLYGAAIKKLYRKYGRRRVREVQKYLKSEYNYVIRSK